MATVQRRATLAGLGVLVLAAMTFARPATPQGTLSAVDTDVQKIANAARASVVTVIGERQIERYDARIKQNVKRPYVRVGSGVAVDQDLIVTTSSILVDAERVWIRTSNDLKSEATVIGTDPIFNVAVLRVQSVRLPPLPLSRGKPPLTGEWVMTVGTSHHRARITETVGTIAHRLDNPSLPLLQLTNQVYPGFSGGAVLNAHGELVGIVQGQVQPSDLPGVSDVRGAVALPSSAVAPAVDELRAGGRVPHGFLGVSTLAANVQSQTEPGLTVGIGAYVEGVAPGGPADRAGLQRGDLIVAFERDRVEFPEQLARWVAATRPGTTVELIWVRDEVQQIGRVTLGESPHASPEWSVAGATAEGAPKADPRIHDLQRQIQKLSREVDRLKSGASRDSR